MEEMKQSLFIGIVACVTCLSAWSQELDTIPATDMMVELKELVVTGGLSNTWLKGNAMITRVEGTSLAQSGTLGEMLVKVPRMTGTEEAPEVLSKGAQQRMKN